MPSAATCLTIFVFYITSRFVAPDGTETTTEKPENVPPDEYDDKCYQASGNVNFFAWVVRIMVRDYPDHSKPPNGDGTLPTLPPHYIATGNIITEDYVLTACTPFVTIMEGPRWDLVRVLPAVIEYTKVLPEPEKGRFPWCVDVGCIIGHYHVHNGFSITDRKCDNRSDDYPTVMSTNLMLLQLSSRIEGGDYKLFPRMPFNYNIEPLVDKIDWFNSYRKARCVIGRIKDATTSQDSGGYDVTDYTYKFEREGYHYATLPYRGNCAPAICEKNCSSIAETTECQQKIQEKKECAALNKCLTTCKDTMDSYLGTIMCLIRMHENEQGVTLIWSTSYDFDNKQTAYTEENKCVLETEHPASTTPLYMGAPVVCDGEVIAIVTKCDKDFLVATSIVGIRHRLLKLFDTSYENDLVYLAET